MKSAVAPAVMCGMLTYIALHDGLVAWIIGILVLIVELIPSDGK